MYQSETGYFLYVVFLFLSTGALILTVDAKRYKTSNLRREGKYAFFMGWFNVLAGIALWGGNWVYSTYIA
ncbi:CLC_0170 family protein [Paenibacillus sp.]|uniref:CLC_0170 family protein n=1 Tax=Paenibacillus sp. TaxID=58172 RepID=UPI00281212D2|nr:CLC_0170 family protein [Paenibacillus sp.]